MAHPRGGRGSSGRSPRRTSGALGTIDILHWAEQVSQRSNPLFTANECQKFVRMAFGSAGGAATAAIAWQQSGAKHQGDDNPPPGVAVYWSGGAGHAAISAGNGMVYSTDIEGPGVVSLVPISYITNKWGKTYLGWTSQVNEKTITNFNAQPENGGSDVATYPTNKAGSGKGLAKNAQTADYGWADAVFNANPELKKLLVKAKANDWDQATMQAAIRGTDWYREHSVDFRKFWVMRRDNPAGWQQEVRKANSNVAALAAQLGVKLTPEEQQKIAHDSLYLGLSDQELQDSVGKFFQGKGGDFVGTAGDIQDQLRASARDYGVTVSDDWIAAQVKRQIDGQGTAQEAQNHLSEMAKSAYPALAAQIDGGSTVTQLAEPYVQSMSNILEVPSTSLSAMDPSIRRALQGVNAKGEPQVTPTWQFETQLRKDPRWLTTKNARASIDNIGAGVLRTWGVM